MLHTSSQPPPLEITEDSGVFGSFLFFIPGECDEYMTALAAKAMGFDGVYVEDEQGSAIMIECSGRSLEYCGELK